MKISISIIIPVYNVEDYLRTCIDSVLVQNVKDIEIILVNDCSPDNSESIIKEYQKLDSRIIYIKHKTNSGAGIARNTGLQKAQGEYIFFLDSDDFLHRDALLTLYKKMQKSKVDIVIGGYIPIEDTIYSQKKIEKIDINSIKNSHFVYKKDLQLEGAKAIVPMFGKMISLNGILAPAWNKLYRKTLFTNNNIEYLGGVFTEDLATTPKLLLQAKSVLLVKETLYFYRLRDNSAINNVNLEHQIKLIEDIYQSIDSVREYFIAKNEFFRYYHTLQHMFCANLMTPTFNNKFSDTIQRQIHAKFFAILSLESVHNYSLFDSQRFKDFNLHLLSYPNICFEELTRWVWFASLNTPKKLTYLCKWILSIPFRIMKTIVRKKPV